MNIQDLPCPEGDRHAWELSGKEITSAVFLLSACMFTAPAGMLREWRELRWWALLIIPLQVLLVGPYALLLGCIALVAVVVILIMRFVVAMAMAGWRR